MNRLKAKLVNKEYLPIHQYNYRRRVLDGICMEKDPSSLNILTVDNKMLLESLLMGNIPMVATFLLAGINFNIQVSSIELSILINRLDALPETKTILTEYTL